MAFWNRKEERAEVTPEIESEALLSALLGKDSVTRDTAMQIPAVNACVSLIAGTIAGLPIRLYEKTPDVKEITDDSRLFLLNSETGDTLTSVQFWQAMIADYFLGRGAFAYLNKRGGRLESIHYVREAAVSYIKNADPIFKDYDILVQGNSYHPWNFLKILRHTEDGVHGVSVFEENPMLVSVAYQSLVYEKNLVARGGNKRGFLQSDKTLTKEAFDKLKEAFRRLYSSSDENVVVLNNGVRFQEASNTSVEMQLNENKETNAKEICEIFGVPVSMIVGGATTEDKRVFIRTISNILSDIESSLNRDLLDEDEKQTKYFSFDTRELTRGDIKERYEAYKVGLDSHFLQVDEVRKQEDLEPIGFKWITIGLNDVLLDVKENKIYTPNTNALVDMNSAGVKAGDIQGMKDLEAQRAAGVRNLIITGAPGSGKTTYAREHMTEKDIIVDLDAVKQAFFKKDFHAGLSKDHLRFLTTIRDLIYKEISEGNSPGRAYIVTTQTGDILTEWSEMLNADIHVMDTSLEDCIKNIQGDDTRPNKKLFIKLAKEWYGKEEKDDES